MDRADTFKKKRDERGAYIEAFSAGGGVAGLQFFVVAADVESLAEAWHFAFGLDEPFDRAGVQAVEVRERQ